MSKIIEAIIEAEILENGSLMSLHEICVSLQIDAEAIEDLVAQGVIEPTDMNRQPWQFDSYSLARIRTAIRLQNDLNVNIPGVALALDLLEEIRKLRQHDDI